MPEHVGPDRGNIGELFHHENEWQRDIRDRILHHTFYTWFRVHGRGCLYVDKGRLAMELQKKGVDTLVGDRGGAVRAIEEKIVRWPRDANGAPRKSGHTRFALETAACTVPGRERPGWIWTCEADYLLYCFADASENALDCYLIEMPRLKAWFKPREHEFREHTMPDTWDRAQCRLVPIADVRRSVGATHYPLEAPPGFRNEEAPS